MENELKRVLKKIGVFEKAEELSLDSSLDVLSKSSSDLQRQLRVNDAQAQDILKAASKDAYDWRMREKTGHELIQHDFHSLTTGDVMIDKVLNGGVSPGEITEIVGESSSGKTQLALQLCITAQKPISEGGLDGSAVYIHSEGPFPSARLDQLVSSYPSDRQQTLKNNIYTIRINDSEEQYRLLSYQLPAFLLQQKKAKKQVRVVVIDSISAIYRSELTPVNRRFNKMSEICEIGSRLKKMASQFDVAIVAVNQVSDVLTKNNNPSTDQLEHWMDFRLINSNENNHMIGLYIQSLLKRPVLGLSWSNSVNTRIRLARSPMLDGMITRRVLFVEFSPKAQRLGCEVMIDDSGIHAKD
ncbi:P-loop containing nucleoside triphosphate hydrolase protein [Cokeromyces recurvatus]|uniref:P-loop containing nucleoside triphosphate hydrolase protein n=1 Tax=Cokeromyces recurvatus TaxID=90255 RepID=UPI00221F17C2|nr:P-loop containing nucleoside triphosphate hydrolase protein [Cokeromyces recurvatus]KAI7906735.1 P-loop containing nucleoside triphosphate hydrolase protein [Cokeromyces recurvatus]